MSQTNQADKEFGKPAVDTRFLNRELSQIAFNRRVLAQAEDPSIPLLERLRYLCIVSSNLDEFFEVRIASLMARNRNQTGSKQTSFKKDLEGMSPVCHALVRRQYAVLNESILPALAKEGVLLLRHHERDAPQRA